VLRYVGVMARSLQDPDVLAALKPARAHPSPADWRDQWIYFLLVDRFNNPAATPRFPPYNRMETRYQGGRLRGIQNQLPYLKDLGVGAVWLSPVLKNPPGFPHFWGGYLIQDFLRVEPRFCTDPTAALGDPAIGDAELRQLVDEAHRQGLYVILDIVLNHVGNLFTYKNLPDEPAWTSAPQPHPIAWRNADHVPDPSWEDISQVPAALADAGVWPAELRRNDYFRRRGGENGAPAYQGDFGGGLRELVTEYVKLPERTFPVRDHLIRCYQYLIGKFDIDGYRIDTLQYVEPAFARVFGNAMREYALSIGKTNFFTFGEVWQENDEQRIAEFVGRDSAAVGDDLVGVDAALDFPIWRRLRDVARGFLPPAALASHYEQRRSAQRKIVSSHGDASGHFVTFLDNHDLNDRFYFADPQGRYDDQHVLATALLFALQGIPCLYYGAEQGLTGRGDAREATREALWGMPNPFDTQHKFYKAIRALAGLRAREPALRYGRQYFRKVSGDGNRFDHSPYPGGVIAFSRILNDRELLVVANTNIAQGESLFVEIDRQLNPDGRTPQVLYSNLHANPQTATVPSPVTTRAGRAAVRVGLGKMELQVIA
jgi:glycosidase